MKEFFDISFFYTSVEDIPEKEELKQFRKEILLQFQFSDSNFINVDEVEFSKQQIVDLFEDFNANYDFYIKLRSNPDIFRLLNDKDNEPFYCILPFDHNSDFSIWLKPFVNDELYKRYISYFNGEMDSDSVDNLMVIKDYFSIDFIEEANDKIEQDLLVFVDDLSSKYLNKDIHAYNRNAFSILNDWNMNKHNLIVKIIKKPLLEMSYARFLNSMIIEVLKNGQAKFSRMPDQYYTVMKLTIRYVDNTLHTCKELADQIENRHADAEHSEYSTWHILFLIIFIIRIITLILR